MNLLKSKSAANQLIDSNNSYSNSKSNSNSNSNSYSNLFNINTIFDKCQIFLF